MFQHVEFYPGDPILGLMEKYNQDPRSEKVNLGVGVYYDGEGRLPVLDSVKTVERTLADSPRPRGYLPMEGTPAYRAACQKLLFGENNPAVQEGRIATIQSLGGSGALRVGADFIREWFPQAKCYPQWDKL